MTNPMRSPQRFSSDVEEALTTALVQWFPTWRAEPHELLQAALMRLCQEAHVQQLGPERVLVAVKAAWAAVPVGTKGGPEQKAIAFERVLGYCLEAYYGKPDRS